LGCALVVQRLRRKEGTLTATTTSLAKQYGKGKLVGLKVGVDRQVIVTSLEVAKDVASCPELDGRPTGPFARFKTLGLLRGISIYQYIQIDDISWWYSG
jgi:hypothetical protein